MPNIYGQGGLRVRAHCGVNGARHFCPHFCLGHIKILVHDLDVHVKKILVHDLDVHVKVGGAHCDPRRSFEL